MNSILSGKVETLYHFQLMKIPLLNFLINNTYGIRAEFLKLDNL